MVLSCPGGELIMMIKMITVMVPYQGNLTTSRIGALDQSLPPVTEGLLLFPVRGERF